MFNKMSLLKIILLLLIAWFILNSCSIDNPYRKPNFIPEHINTIYLFRFMNDTKNPTITQRLYKEFKREFSFSKTLAVTYDIKEADAVLEGRIKKLFFQAVNYTPTGNVDKARYYLELDFSLKDISKDNYLMTNQSISVVRVVNFYTEPVVDKYLVLDEMITNVVQRIVSYCIAGRRDDFNVKFGFENKPLFEDDGTLIGKEKKNYDKNNDGIDDRYQFITNRSGLTNIYK